MSEPYVAPPERCASCGSSDLTRLPMVLTDGTEVLFVSCQVCEGREWLNESDGQWVPLSIDTVIERSARKP